MKRILFFAVLMVAQLGFGQTIRTFSTAGTSPFVAPAGVTAVTAKVWGAGGGGGRSFVGAAGGGGGGAFTTNTITVVPGTPYDVRVGTGGIGGTSSSTTGAVGQSSWFGSTSILSAVGGNGGGSAGFFASGTGATAVTTGNVGGTTNFYGGAGANGNVGSTYSGGGGGGANSTMVGNPASGVTGGAPNTDGGNGGNGVTSNTGSNPGLSPGGGGGGAGYTNNGGKGGDGRVILSYTCPTYSLTSTVASSVNICSATSTSVTLNGTPTGLPSGIYNVSYEIQGVAQTPATINVTTAGTSSFIATGFTTVGTRTIRITALTSGNSATLAENCSSTLSSNNISTVTILSSGTAPVATAGTGATCTAITANWNAIAGATYYELDVATDSGFSSIVSGYNAVNVGNVLTRIITGLPTATTYYYRVRAFNGVCISANSNPITYAVAVAPATPTTPTNGGNSCTQFTLNWTAVAGATSYNVQRATNVGFTTGVVSFSGITASSYIITGLTANTQYWYRVQAQNGCNTSTYSPALGAIRTLNATVFPSGVGSNTILCAQMNVTWTNVAGAASYTVEAATNSTFTTGKVTATGIATSPHTLTGLMSGTTYYYRVSAVNGCGTGITAAGSTITTSTSAPTAPTGVVSSNVLCTQFTMSWTASLGAVTYEVEIADDAGFTINSGTDDTVTGTNYTFTGLAPNKQYYYRVRSRNGCGFSGYTNGSPAFITTAVLPTKPTITADGALTICQTDGVTLTSSATSGNVWSTGETTQSIFVTAAGNYTVQVNTAGGCTSAISDPRTITIQGLPTAIAGGSQTICSNGSATVSGATATNGTISWAFSGGFGTLTNATTLTPTYTPLLGGAARTVILTMTVTSNNACTPQIATATYTVNILAAPTATVGGGQGICANSTATVPSGVALATNYDSILWTHNGAGSLTNPTTLTPTYNPAIGDTGNFITLTMNVTANCNTPYIVSDIYTINVRANNTTTTASTMPIICLGTAIPNVTHTTTGATDITNAGISGANGLPAGVSATWATNTITISGTPTASGTFNYSIPLLGGCGTANATGTITVNQAPAGLSYTTPASYCINTAITANNATLTTPGSPAATYAVSPALPAGLSLNTTTGQITGTPTVTVGTTNYTITATNTCDNTTAAISITVNPVPTPATVTKVDASCTVSTGSITITAPTGMNYSIDGTDYTNTDGIFTSVAAGTYQVTVKNNATGCISPATEVIIDQQQLKTWTGTTSTDWNIGTNWNPNGVPTASDCVVIPDVTNKPVVALDAYAKNIEVQTGGELIFLNNSSLLQDPLATVNSNSGAIEYRRISSPMKNFDYTYWSSPVLGQTTVGLSPNTFPDKYFSFNGTTGAWVLDKGTMIPGKGYIIRVPKPGSPSPDNWSGALYPQPVAFKGIPNNGNYPYSVGANQFNLVGNPYPSAVDADAFINENSLIIDGALYFWTHATPITSNSYATNDYATYTLTGGAGTGGNLVAEWVDANKNRTIDPGETNPNLGGTAGVDTGEWEDYNVNNVVNTNEWTDTNNNNIAETGEWTDTNKNKIVDAGEWVDSNSDSIKDFGEWTDTNTNDFFETDEWVDFNFNYKLDVEIPLDANKPLGTIAAGQSFFVGNAAAGSFQFTNAMRIVGNNDKFYKQANTKKTAAIEKNRVWLNLTNTQGAFKQLLVGYITGATNNWDNLYDGESFDGQTYIDFYSLSNSKKLTIQGRALPFENTDEVPLGYRSTIAGPFEIGIDNRDGKLSNQEIWLEDKKTGAMHDLTSGKYNFIAIKGAENDRFVLKYTNKTLGTGDNELAEKRVLIAVKDKKITITSSAEAIAQIQIYDLLGRKIYEKSKINTREWLILNLPSSEQTLIVKTTLQNGAVTSQKIIF